MRHIPECRTERRCERVKAVLSQRQDDLTLVLANIHDPHNVSAIYRSCDAFGVGEVILYYTTTAFPTLHRKTSASARKWVESSRIDSPQELRKNLRERNLQILVTSCAPEAVSLWDIDFLQPTAIVLGNEHAGVEPALMELADRYVHIPMAGMIQSLNVSVAAAVLLAEAARQRRAAGLYENSRMDPALYQARLAAWLER